MPDKMKILYVDDEQALLTMGKIFLEESGPFSVDTQTSAQSALSVMGSTDYDAIISDYQMPGMDGIGFLKQIRKMGNTTPFILFTGRGREEIVIQALNEGADFYLQKGGDPEPLFAELTHKIRQAVQQRRAEATIRDHERREADIINFLPDATFAIDARGVVIAWNLAMEDFSGVPSGDIMGKGNYEYALSTYHERRPMLIDLILKDDPAAEAKYPDILRYGKKIFSEIFLPERNNGAGALFWITASPIYDAKGKIVGAIESIRDISDRKKTETALRESAERYKSLITISKTGAWEYDRDRNYIWCCPEYFSLLGRDAGQYDLSGAANLKEVWTDLIHPDDRDQAVERFIQYLETGSPGIYDNYFRMLHADGHWIWIWSRGWTLRHENGTPMNKTIGTHIDITESRRAEEEQRIYTEHLCLAQEMGQIGSWELNIANGTIWGSDEAFRIYGIQRPADSLIHHHEIEAKIPEWERVVQAIHDLIETGAPYDIEYTINPGDGSGSKTIHSVARVLYNAERKPAGVAGVIRDITLRIQAERELKNTYEELNAAYNQIAAREQILMQQLNDISISQKALRESEARFHCIVETANEGIWAMDSQFITTYVNLKMADLLGYTTEEMICRNITDFMDPGEIPDNALKMQNRKEGLDENYERKFMHKDGSVRVLQVSVSALKDPLGAFAGSFARFSDITDKKGSE
ncbi:MAG: PAS domain S-box protein [Methanoregula sp.]|jgi:PAS domain S-box-containing protein|nr:PAS domain S-box protein [Methanoregula sp.]